VSKRWQNLYFHNYFLNDHHTLTLAWSQLLANPLDTLRSQWRRPAAKRKQCLVSMSTSGSLVFNGYMSHLRIKILSFHTQICIDDIQTHQHPYDHSPLFLHYKSPRLIKFPEKETNKEFTLGNTGFNSTTIFCMISNQFCTSIEDYYFFNDLTGLTQEGLFY